MLLLRIAVQIIISSWLNCSRSFGISSQRKACACSLNCGWECRTWYRENNSPCSHQHVGNSGTSVTQGRTGIFSLKSKQSFSLPWEGEMRSNQDWYICSKGNMGNVIQGEECNRSSLGVCPQSMYWENGVYRELLALRKEGKRMVGCPRERKVRKWYRGWKQGKKGLKEPFFWQL